MKKITLTCPFTGVAFDALKCADETLIVQNPLSGENMRITYNPIIKKYLIDRDFFDLLETVNCAEAAKLLDVSRARISKIVQEDVIPNFKVNGKHMFMKQDIINYKKTRKTGRPIKEREQ